MVKKYIVREGDTMWSISQASGVKINLLMAANPQIPDPNQLRPGSVLIIPELNKKPTYKPTNAPEGMATTMPGTTMQGTAWAPEPVGTPATPNSTGMMQPFFGFVWTHITKSGETLQSIAAKYGAPLAHLMHLNPSKASLLKEGEPVYVPSMPSSQGGEMAQSPTTSMPTPMTTAPAPDTPMPMPSYMPQGPGFEPIGPHTHTPYGRDESPPPGDFRHVTPTADGFWAFIPYHPERFGLSAQELEPEWNPYAEPPQWKQKGPASERNTADGDDDA